MAHVVVRANLNKLSLLFQDDVCIDQAGQEKKTRNTCWAVLKKKKTCVCVVERERDHMEMMMIIFCFLGSR